MGKVVPGEKLGVEEEFLPGSGSYLEEGLIFSLAIGEPEYKNKQITVKNKIKLPATELLKQRKRIEVIGIVESILEPIAFVRVEPVNKNIVLPSNDAILHVSNINRGYVEKIREKIRIGDIIKAQLIKIEGERIYISLFGSNGVIEAFCSKCRSRMINLGFQKGSNLVGCPNCGYKETRKLAR